MRQKAFALTVFVLGAPSLVGCPDEAAGPSPGGGGAGGEGTTASTAVSSSSSSSSVSSASSASSASSSSGTGGTGGGACGDDLPTPEETLPGTVDPAGGVFTLDQALDGLPEGPGPLRAIIDTDLGVITCEFFPDESPMGVANFVGLARGLRPWKDPVSNTWVKRRFYDGLKFHRVINDFMTQGGDPLGTGTGGPGYKLKDEIGKLKHQVGTLAYANAGPNTSGSQFYITEIKTDFLDGKYTIFGQCGPLSVIETITAVPTDASDRPLTPIGTKSVKITRCAP